MSNTPLSIKNFRTSHRSTIAKCLSDYNKNWNLTRGACYKLFQKDVKEDTWNIEYKKVNWYKWFIMATTQFYM